MSSKEAETLLGELVPLLERERSLTDARAAIEATFKRIDDAAFARGAAVSASQADDDAKRFQLAAKEADEAGNPKSALVMRHHATGAAYVAASIRALPLTTPPTGGDRK